MLKRIKKKTVMTSYGIFMYYIQYPIYLKGWFIEYDTDRNGGHISNTFFCDIVMISA